MAAFTKIEWARHTFNPWLGCTRLSAACDHCYAESWAKRTGQEHLWNGERRRTTDAYWRQPLKWNAAAGEAGERHRVFCASLADVFDNQADEAWRADLWKLIAATPNLDWLLLTKRPQNIAKMLPPNWGSGYPNVWLGTTVENQTEAERRIPRLLDVPAKVRFLSCEPLLDRIDLQTVGVIPAPNGYYCLASEYPGLWGKDNRRIRDVPKIDWIIVGVESGSGARPMDVQWARYLLNDCRRGGTAFFFKQTGGTRKPFPPPPDDLNIQEFPVPA